MLYAQEPEELDKKDNEEKSSDLKDSNEKEEEPMEEEGEGNKGFAPQVSKQLSLVVCNQLRSFSLGDYSMLK